MIVHYTLNESNQLIFTLLYFILKFLVLKLTILVSTRIFRFNTLNSIRTWLTIIFTIIVCDII